MTKVLIICFHCKCTITRQSTSVIKVRYGMDCIVTANATYICTHYVYISSSDIMYQGTIITLIEYTQLRI